MQHYILEMSHLTIFIYLFIYLKPQLIQMSVFRVVGLETQENGLREVLILFCVIYFSRVTPNKK
jgi:hypothetical protein